ncbi:hypothetical protein V6S67_06995 [Arthrobacter sp. Soc17.1.1.1]|uniref:hypothetical protein n=1 Tax=Arthrobacter sp. Soc17.1.1.1 TaxID=3121277 RepID=UPI002FE471F7
MRDDGSTVIRYRGGSTVDLEFREDPAVLEPTSVEITRNTARNMTDVCDLLDEAPTKGES